MTIGKIALPSKVNTANQMNGIHKKNSMMKKALRYCCFFVFLLISAQLSAQTVQDALRLSTFDWSGTARAAAVGGGMGALGADFSVASTNPAGLAWFRSSDFTITPTLWAYNTDAQLQNGTSSSTSTNGNRFGLDNFGIVVANQPMRSVDWRSSNFAIGLNRLANFNQTFEYSGQSLGSRMDRFAELANSNGIDDLYEASVAFDALGLIDDNGTFRTDIERNPDAPISKTQTVTTTGSINELVFSLAGNYQEKIMIGLTLGIPFVNLTDNRVYRETDPGDDIPVFEAMQFEENLRTTGAGINLKLGLIYRINQMSRVGLAIHTPTAYSLEDSYETQMQYDYSENGLQSGFAQSPADVLPFEYTLVTPWRFIGSAGFIINKSGFISGDIEWVNYGGARFRYQDFPTAEQEINDDIQDGLASALNIRVGGEFVYEMLRFRAGIGLLQAGITDNSDIQQVYSAGVGYRRNAFSIDAAYRLQTGDDTFTPYQITNGIEQSVAKDFTNNRIIVTLGLKF